MKINDITINIDETAMEISEIAMKINELAIQIDEMAMNIIEIRHRASGTGWRVVSPAAAVLLTLLEFSAGTPAGPGKSLKQ